MLKNLSILIVEDDPIDRQVYKRLLKQESNHFFDFNEADTAAAGYNALEQSYPDCLLLDYRLPDEDGIEFLEQVANSELAKRTPIVMLTGQGSESIAVEAMKFGVHDYLVKSELTAQSLINAVLSAIRNKELETKLEAKQQDLQLFASIAAHDLNAPLRNIDYVTTKILNHLNSSLDDTTQGYFKELVGNIHRMQDLLNALISYTKSDTQSLDLQPHSLKTLINYSIENIQRVKSEANAQINASFDDIHVIVDKVVFAQLLQNLFTNAIRYCDQQPIIDINVQPCIDTTTITIKDNGIGFEPEFISEAFKPFKQASNNKKGCGLGLATCHRIIERHQGSISIESQPGQGTTFTVEIPNSDCSYN